MTTDRLAHHWDVSLINFCCPDRQSKAPVCHGPDFADALWDSSASSVLLHDLTWKSNRPSAVSEYTRSCGGNVFQQRASPAHNRAGLRVSCHQHGFFRSGVTARSFAVPTCLLPTGDVNSRVCQRVTARTCWKQEEDAFCQSSCSVRLGWHTCRIRQGCISSVGTEARATNHTQEGWPWRLAKLDKEHLVQAVEGGASCHRLERTTRCQLIVPLNLDGSWY